MFYKNLPVASILWLPASSFIYLNVILFFTSCSRHEPTYNPCFDGYESENILASPHSLNWIPYQIPQKIKLISTLNDTILLRQKSEQVKIESLKSLIKITCPYDTSQLSYIKYTTFAYDNIFEVTGHKYGMESFNFQLDVIVDEFTSTYGNLKYADIIRVFVKFTNGNTKLILQFPVLNRGYDDALATAFKFYEEILLQNKSYFEIFSNYDNEDSLILYYSESGLEAINIQGQLYLTNH